MVDLVVAGVGFLDVVNVIEDINLNKREINFLGFIDDNQEKLPKNILGYPILGPLDWIADNPNVSVFNSIAKNTIIRKKSYLKLLDLNASFYSLIHPSVNIRHSDIASGVLICSNVNVEPKVKIGSQTMILTNTTIGHDSIIGSNCFVAPGANILGSVKIDDECFIGSGAVIYPGRHIGSNSTIGINSTVINNIEKFTTVFSSPGRQFKNG